MLTVISTCNCNGWNLAALEQQIIHNSRRYKVERRIADYFMFAGLVFSRIPGAAGGHQSTTDPAPVPSRCFRLHPQIQDDYFDWSGKPSATPPASQTVFHCAVRVHV